MLIISQKRNTRIDTEKINFIMIDTEKDNKFNIVINYANDIEGIIATYNSLERAIEVFNEMIEKEVGELKGILKFKMYMPEKELLKKQKELEKQGIIVTDFLSEFTPLPTKTIYIMPEN